MKRLGLLVLIFIFHIFYNSYASLQYWDVPKPIEASSPRINYQQPRVLITENDTLIFYVENSGRSSEIFCRELIDFYQFDKAISVSGEIKGPAGFVPEYDVFYYETTVYIAYTLYNGEIILKKSQDNGKTWKDVYIYNSGKSFVFHPEIFIYEKVFFLFYHAESEGRRIDFFVSISREMESSWSDPVQIAVGFAGSFFPSVIGLDGTVYVVWHSRPFIEKGVPVFHLYGSLSRDLGNSWSQPKKLTENENGDNIRPVLVVEKGNLRLVWQSDRSGVWSIYSRSFDKDLNPLSDVVKVARVPANCINPFVLDDGKRKIFYLSRRGGGIGIYVSVETPSGYVEYGPFGGKSGEIIEYFPFKYRDKICLIFQDSSGLLYLGPDVTVSEVKIIRGPGKYVGRRGFKIRFVPPSDPNGINGIMYLFTDNPEEFPDIINFQIHEEPGVKPHEYSLSFIPEKEGRFYLHIRAVDGAGNLSPVKTLAFEVDLTPPPPPEIVPLDVDEKGYYESNSPIFRWKPPGGDVVGFNYYLSRKPRKIVKPIVKSRGTRVKFSNLNGGTWYFNIASIDRAGNTSETKTLSFKLYPLKVEKVQPERKVEEVIKKVQKPPIKWIISFFKPSAEPFLNIVLYIFLFSLAFTISVVFAEVAYKFFIRKRRFEMKPLPEEKRKFGFGLRLKFSLLIIGLILILTVGISSVLTSITVKQERRALALQMKERAILSIENITNIAREGILNNDELLLLSVIRKTMQNTDIKYGIILDNSGKVIAHSDLEMKGKTLSDDITTRMMESSKLLIIPDFDPDALSEVYHLGMPITFAGKRIGTARIGYSTDSIFEAIGEMRRNSIYTTIFVTIVTVILGLIGAVVMATFTIKPLKILAEGARIIGTGNLQYKIQVMTRDEIGMLASEFNKMTDQLLLYQREMEKKAKLDEQLEIARRIQQDLIPSEGIENDWLSISGFYKAASGVGGDYYDYVEIGSSKYGIIMSDVAGKGVPASLMMMMIRSIFKSLINTGISSTSEIVTLMNNTLAADISSDRFATLLFGIYDVRERVFRYTNAGYGPLLIYRRDEKKCELLESKRGSIPIGVMDDIKYEEEDPLKMEAGDIVVLFTDGIHEARNEREEEFGLERLLSIVPGYSKKDSGEIASGIVKEVLTFTGSAEQYDDMTLLVMKVKK